MGGNLPFVPGVYQPNTTIAELILRAGQERARGQQQLGQTISDAVRNIGDTAQQGFAQRQRMQNEQKIQGAVSGGLASPDSFEAALQALPPEIRSQARKEYTDASDAAARIAERHAKTAQEKALTLKAQQQLQQQNIDDMGTIAFRAQSHASDPDGGLSAMLGAQHALKANRVQGVENFDGPLQQLTDSWQKAVASNDPAQITAAAEQNRAAGNAVFGHILMNVSTEHMQKLLNEQTKPLTLHEGDIAYDPITHQKLMEGGPRPKTLDQQIAEAPLGSAVSNEALQKKAAVAAAGQTDSVPTLTPAGMDIAAEMFAKTGTLPPMGMGKAGATVRQAIINRAAVLHPGLDVAGAKAGYGADTESMKALQKQTDAVTAFESTASKNAALLNDVMKTVPDLGSKLLNRPLRALAGSMGSEDIAKLDAIRQSVANEYSRIISNPNLVGTLSDTARKEGDALLSAGATVGQIKAALATLASEAHNRKTSYQEQLDAIKKRVSGQGATAAPGAGAFKVGGYTVEVIQ